MDNLQQSLIDAEWERRAAEQQPYRVLAPRAPGAVSYWMALALVADGAGRDDLVQPALDAAGAAAEVEALLLSRASILIDVLRTARDILANGRDPNNGPSRTKDGKLRWYPVSAEEINRWSNAAMDAENFLNEILREVD